MFIQNTTYVNLLLFLECASRLEHVGLNKYFWHIYKVTMTCFTTRHIQAGGGGWGQHFSTLRAPKLMTHWAPRVFDLLDTPLIILGVIYRAHTSRDSFNANINNILQILTKENKNHYLLGDFNIDLLKDEIHRPTSAFTRPDLLVTFSPYNI